MRHVLAVICLVLALVTTRSQAQSDANFPVVFLGTFSTVGGLPSASSNEGNLALITGSGFYLSDGTTWQPVRRSSLQTTASIGGSLLLLGGCASTTVTFTGVTTVATAIVYPMTFTQGTYSMFTISGNVVTIYLCAGVATITPTATVFTVTGFFN